MGDVLSESIELCMAPQPTLGTDPSANWTKLQIDKGSLKDWKKTLQTVERNIHSKFMVPRKGDVVGWTVSPGFAHDCNKDFFDLIAEAVFRCVGQHPGGTDQRLYRPTAVVDGGGSNDSFTVPSNGALPNGVLIYSRGMTTAANNGLFVTAGSSTSTAIRVATATLTAEASTPSNATVDVVGFQGASADITMNASGHLTSTLLDFTTLDLKKGMLLKIGGTAANTFFATAADNGWAYIAATPTANLITLEGWTFTPAADTGTGKTIQIFTPSLYRNYAIDDSAYAKKLLYGELSEPLAGSDSSTRYQYCKGLLPNTLEISAPLKSKITATLNLIGTDATDPLALASRLADGAGRGTGPGTAFEPLANALVDTANDLTFIRMRDSGGALVNEVNDWSLSIGNSVSPKEVQGTAGAVGHHAGEFTHKLTVGAYYNDSDQVAAAADNRDLDFDVCIQNHQFAFAFRLPTVAMRGDNRAYEANMQVKLNFESPAFGSETTNVAGQLCIFGYVPE